MKPYFVVGIHPEGRPSTEIGSWYRFLSDRTAAAAVLHNTIDDLIRRYRLAVWVAREYSHAVPGTWSPDEIATGLNNVYRFILREEREIPPALIDELRLLPIVRFAHIGHALGSALPAAQSFDGYVTGRPWRGSENIGLDDARAYTRGDSAIRIAVLDTGVCLNHPELQGRLDEGFDCVDLAQGMDSEALKDFVGDYLEMDPVPDDEVGHGSHVSGIIGGKGIQMPLGVASECRIIPVRTLAAMKKGDQIIGAGLEENINYAIKWAVDHKAHVINMSLGVRHEGGGLPHEQVVEYAKRKGVTIVAASGNDGRRELYYPGALPHVIAVGAATDNGEVAPFSTYGDQVTIIAPGTNILSCFFRDGYAVASGTSQAAPFVTGAIALLKSFARKLGRTLSDSQVKYTLKNTADKIDKEFKHPKAGFGHLNIADAMRLLEYRLSG